MKEQIKDRQNQQTEKNPDDCIENIAVETGNGIEKSQNSKNTSNRSSKNPWVIKRIIAFFSNERNQSKVSNFISFGMLVVTFFLFFYTYRLYKTASDDSKTARLSAQAANTSAIIAQKTLDTTRKYYLLSLIKQQKAIDDNNASSQLTFERASKSLTLQDSSLKESENEFEIENRPFLETANFTVDSTNKKKWIISFILANAGKQPLKIISGEFKDGYGADPNYKTFGGYSQKNISDNVYLSYQGFTTITDNDVINDVGYESVRNGTSYIYILGEYKYISVETMKTYFFKFDTKITIYPRYKVESLVNESY